VLGQHSTYLASWVVTLNFSRNPAIHVLWSTEKIAEQNCGPAIMDAQNSASAIFIFDPNIL
jgi:hypothetical protein